MAGGLFGLPLRLGFGRLALLLSLAGRLGLGRGLLRRQRLALLLGLARCLGLRGQPRLLLTLELCLTLLLGLALRFRFDRASILVRLAGRLGLGSAGIVLDGRRGARGRVLLLANPLEELAAVAAERVALGVLRAAVAADDHRCRSLRLRCCRGA